MQQFCTHYVSTYTFIIITLKLKIMYVPQSCSFEIRFMLVAIILTAVCIKPLTTICLDIQSDLYCTNLENNTQNKIVLSRNKTVLYNEVEIIYLRNSSGEIDDNTFSNFSTLKILDIQFCSIYNFSLKVTAIDSLYLLYNLKFPKLSAEIMGECCRNLSILIIMDNGGLEIETGAFKYMKRLTHLTISKQNITNLTRGFFEGLEKLVYLNLRGNGILEIDENAFERLTELNHLILSDNNFTTLGLNTFKNLKILEAIEMHGIEISGCNISIFENQKELKVLDLPTALIKAKIDLNVVIKTFPKLETIGFRKEDAEDVDVAEFIRKCTSSGYNIKFSY